MRLDSTGKMARALYRWRKQDAAQYTVIVYRVEQGEWKIDDFSVRRSGMPAPAKQTLSEAAAAAAQRDRDSTRSLTRSPAPVAVLAASPFSPRRPGSTMADKFRARPRRRRRANEQEHPEEEQGDGRKG